MNKYFKYGVVAMFAIVIALGAIAADSIATLKKVQITAKEIEVSQAVIDSATEKKSDLSTDIIEAGRIAKEREAVGKLRGQFMKQQRLCEANADIMQKCIDALNTVVG